VHIVIVGAGEVGWYLARRLGAEGHDVVVVEMSETIARAIGEDLDVQVAVGSGTSPSVLLEAGCDRADLLAGVTQSDEVNLIAARLAKLLGTRQTVVRIQSEELRGSGGAALLEAMCADLIIDPDADTADEMFELLHSSGADEVYPLSVGDLIVLGSVIEPGSELAGRTLAEIARDFEPDWPFLFGAVTRHSQTVIPRGDLTLEAGDHVRVLTSRARRNQILKLLGQTPRRIRKAMVLGGGAVGERVADRLEDESVAVVLVERDPIRARIIADRLTKVTVIEGDITDTELLQEEGIGAMDVVIAATGDDTSNVLACAFAASEGRAFTVTVLHRLQLLPLVRRFGIDAALSPRTASANAVLRHMRGGTGSVATFLESDVEVTELTVEAGSSVAGRRVADLHLPHSILLGAVIKPDGTSVIARGHRLLEAGDNVAVFARPESLAQLYRRFRK
jgi:trk system potassium uptake protein TrkA